MTPIEIPALKKKFLGLPGTSSQSQATPGPQASIIYNKTHTIKYF